MGVTILTALEIQTNKVKVVSKGPFENKKYGMSILMIRDGDVHKEMLSVDYGHFETKKEAVKYGMELVKEIREMKL